MPTCEATANASAVPGSPTDAEANGRASPSANESGIGPSQESASATSDEPGPDGHESENEIGHAAHGGEAISSVSDGLLHVSPSYNLASDQYIHQPIEPHNLVAELIARIRRVPFALAHLVRRFATLLGEHHADVAAINAHSVQVAAGVVGFPLAAELDERKALGLLSTIETRLAVSPNIPSFSPCNAQFCQRTWCSSPWGCTRRAPRRSARTPCGCPRVCRPDTKWLVNCPHHCAWGPFKRAQSLHAMD